MVFCEFWELFGNTFLQNTSVRLLLKILHALPEKQISGIFPKSVGLTFKRKNLRERIEPFDQRYCRSSHQRCSMKKDVLRNFAKFTGKHLCQSLFFNKVTGLLLLYLKRGSGTSAFLWILRHFWEHLFTERLWTTVSGFLLKDVSQSSFTENIIQKRFSENFLIFKKQPFLRADHITSKFLKAVFRKFHLANSWKLCPKWSVLMILAKDDKFFLHPKFLAQIWCGGLVEEKSCGIF